MRVSLTLSFTFCVLMIVQNLLLKGSPHYDAPGRWQTEGAAIETRHTEVQYVQTLHLGWRMLP